jgi:hypothetical protein
MPYRCQIWILISILIISFTYVTKSNMLSTTKQKTVSCSTPAPSIRHYCTFSPAIVTHRCHLHNDSHTTKARKCCDLNGTTLEPQILTKTTRCVSIGHCFLSLCRYISFLAGQHHACVSEFWRVVYVFPCYIGGYGHDPSTSAVSLFFFQNEKKNHSLLKK